MNVNISTNPSLVSPTPTTLSDSTRQLYLPVSGTDAAASAFGWCLEQSFLLRRRRTHIDTASTVHSSTRPTPHAAAIATGTHPSSSRGPARRRPAEVPWDDELAKRLTTSTTVRGAAVERGGCPWSDAVSTSSNVTLLSSTTCAKNAIFN